jgi:hypothetical protein
MMSHSAGSTTLLMNPSPLHQCPDVINLGLSLVKIAENETEGTEEAVEAGKSLYNQWYVHSAAMMSTHSLGTLHVSAIPLHSLQRSDDVFEVHICQCPS